MKLEAKAKPVKIRIRSGGEEHSSLESLRHNFRVEDIRPLLDRRLSRWLRQQGEEALAQAVDDFDASRLDTPEGYLEFIRLFFPVELSADRIGSLVDLAAYWSGIAAYRRNGEWLYHYLLDKDLSAAKYLYRQQSLPGVNWAEVFARFEGEEDAEALYILGMLWFNGEGVEKDIEKGYGYITRAAQLRWQDAIQFVLDKRYEEEKAKVENNKKASQSQRSADTTRRVKNSEEGGAISKYTVQEKNCLKEFLQEVKDCYKDGGVKSASQYVVDYIYRNKPVKKEVMFVRGLLYTRSWGQNDSTKADEIYVKLSNMGYLPAQWMLTRANDFIGWSIYQQLKYVEDHLGEY